MLSGVFPDGGVNLVGNRGYSGWHRARQPQASRLGGFAVGWQARLFGLAGRHGGPAVGNPAG